jgi:hypothetical protein
MIWIPISKKDPRTAEPLTRHNAVKHALSSTDMHRWITNEQNLHNKQKEFAKLKAAVYEENYNAFTVADRGKFWYVILK